MSTRKTKRDEQAAIARKETRAALKALLPHELISVACEVGVSGRVITGIRPKNLIRKILDECGYKATKAIKRRADVSFSALSTASWPPSREDLVVVITTKPKPQKPQRFRVR